MEITEVKIIPTFNEKIKAIARITFDHCIVLNRVKIIKSGTRYYVIMPNRPVSRGKRYDICYPTTQEMRKKIEDRVLDTFNTFTT